MIKRIYQSTIRKLQLSKFLNLPTSEMLVSEYCNYYFSTYTPPLLNIYDEEIVSTIPVQHSNIKKQDLFQWYIKWKMPAAFIVRLDKGRIFSKNAAIITKEGILLKDVSRWFGARNRHPVFSLISLPVPKKIKGCLAVLTTAGSDTYYHWLFDILPRLQLIQIAGIMKVVDKFILPQLKYSFQRETLQQLGIGDEKILEIESSDFHISADTLLVPSLPSLLGTINKWTVDFLRTSFIDRGQVQAEKRKKLYISRANASARKLINEHLLIQELEKKGFGIVEAEKYSFKDQVQLYIDASVIVSPHGSGLCNIVFCTEKTKVVEIFDADFMVPCFKILADHCKLEYHCYIEGDINKEQFLINYWDQLPRSYSLNIEAFLAYISSEVL